ncbi:MAG: protein phosphatase 2C domain-containing protein [Muribaculaceae bacterium]|nr:protein phosphatase 2C domain-containing protein [Muribaculaceae bacterium]
MRKDRSLRIIHKTVTVDGLRQRVAKALTVNGHTPDDNELDKFETWLIRRMWNEYQTELMDQRILARNELNKVNLKFPNGRQGTPYKHTVHVDPSVFKCVETSGLSDTGLKLVRDTQGNLTLLGTPKRAGDIEVIFYFEYPGWSKGQEYLERRIHIAFNTDPDSLWQNIPVPEGIDYPKEDTDMKYVSVKVWSDGSDGKDIVAASRRGRSHAHEGSPRDDDFVVSYLNGDEWYVLAVADGAGSAKYSREGSRIACREVETWVRLLLSEVESDFVAAVSNYNNQPTQENAVHVGKLLYNTVVKAAWEASKAIKTESDNKAGAVVKDYSTTLLMAVCRKFDFGWFIATYWVGDGAIGLLLNDGTVKIMGEPDGGEYAGQTRFLTMPSVFSDRTRYRFTIVPDFKALVLMTDGVSDPWFETDANLQRAERWDEMMKSINDNVCLSERNPDCASELLEWLGFRSRGNHDDRTIAILY